MQTPSAEQTRLPSQVPQVPPHPSTPQFRPAQAASQSTGTQLPSLHAVSGGQGASSIQEFARHRSTPFAPHRRMSSMHTTTAASPPGVSASRVVASPEKTSGPMRNASPGGAPPPVGGESPPPPLLPQATSRRLVIRHAKNEVDPL